MKKLLLLLIFLTGCVTEKQPENVLRIHQGKFAFCGASSAIPTGEKIIIQGKEFDEGIAICPVLEGPSISSLAMYGDSGTYGKFNTKENFHTPDGTENTAWSLFWYFSDTDTIPQFNLDTKQWEMMAPVNRKFTIDMSSPSTSESDMFQMPCEIWKTENGILLSPNVDSLFDKHLISFSDEGQMLISNKISENVLNQLGIDKRVILPVSDGMRKYLKRHREIFNQ